MRTYRTTTLVTALAALLGCGVAVGADRYERTDARADRDAQLEREIDYRAANLHDGKAYAGAAKAHVRGHENHHGGGDVRMAAIDHVWRDRAAWMMDRKDYDETSKQSIDHASLHEDGEGRGQAALGEPATIEERLPRGHDQLRAASLHDAKTGYAKAGPHASLGSGDDAAVAALDADDVDTAPVSRSRVGYDAPARPYSAPVVRDSAITGDSLALSELPAAVRATIQRESESGAVLGVDGDEEYGRAVYTARISRADADPLTLKVAEDGAVVWRDDLLERAERGSSSGTVR